MGMKHLKSHDNFSPHYTFFQSVNSSIYNTVYAMYLYVWFSEQYSQFINFGTWLGVVVEVMPHLGRGGKGARSSGEEYTLCTYMYMYTYLLCDGDYSLGKWFWCCLVMTH